MRYNGIAQPWQKFTPNAYAVSNALEIALDDRPVTLGPRVGQSVTIDLLP